MNTTKNLLATFLTLALLGSLAAGLWFGGTWIARLAASADWRSTFDPILGLALAVLLAGFAVSRSLRRARLLEAGHHLREARRGVYESTVLAWESALRDRRSQGGPIASRLPEDLPALETVLAMRASPTVLRLYGRLRWLAAQPDSSPAQLDGQLLALIVEMRRELNVAGWRPDVEVVREAIRPHDSATAATIFAPAPSPARQPATDTAPGCPAFSLSK
jgi:hypothetical protein